MDVGDHTCLDSRKSDAQIVAAALERQVVEALLSRGDSHESKSVFIPLTTATIPICVERGPSDDWASYESAACLSPCCCESCG
jgi:hypothetical protein